MTYKGRPIRITPDFSIETMKARRSWEDVLQTLRDNECKSRLLYPVKLSITTDGENNIFHDKIRFKQYLSTNLSKKTVLEEKPSKLIVPTKTATKPKEGKQTHYH